MMQFEAEHMMGVPGAVLPGPAQASQESKPVAGQQEQHKCRRRYRWLKPKRCVVCSSADIPRGTRPDHCPWRCCHQCRQSIYECREALILEGPAGEDSFVEQTATEAGLRSLILRYKDDFGGQRPEGHKGSKQKRTGSRASCDAATGSVPLQCLHMVAQQPEVVEGDNSCYSPSFEQPTMKRMKVCPALHEKQHSLFDWPDEAFRAIPTVRCNEFAHHRLQTPLLPVLLTDCDELGTLLDTDAQIKNFMACFDDAASTVDVAPGGRAAASLPQPLGGIIAEALLSLFLKHPSFRGAVREVPACPVLAWMRETSIILSQAPMMESSPTEEPVQGRVSYICKGTRDVVACSFASLMHVLDQMLMRQAPDMPLGRPILSIPEVKEQIRLNLHDPMLRAAEWFRVQQPAHSVLYMPTGWLVFESAIDCERVLCLRQFMLVPNSPSWDIYDMLVRAADPPEEALEISDSIHRLLEVQPRSSLDVPFRKGDHWLVSDGRDYSTGVLMVVTMVWSNACRAAFLGVLDPEKGLLVLGWPTDKNRLLRLVLAGPE
jgi:hypothetical protein